MGELKVLVNYLYLLQSSIAFRSRSRPLRENFVVYRGIEQCYEFVPLYKSIAGNVVFLPRLTSTSTDRNYILNHFITDENSVLFEIELHAGDMAVRIEEYFNFRLEREFLITALIGCKVLSVTYADVSVQLDSGGSISLRIPVVRLSSFLHWSDFDLDHHTPLRFLSHVKT
jgi:hypothetical protein